MSNQLLLDMTDKFNAVTEDGHICSVDEPYAEYVLLWRMIFDIETKAYYIEPITDQSSYDGVQTFLERAWARKEDVFFEGKPSVLKVSKDIKKNFPDLGSWLSTNNVILGYIGKEDAPTIGLGTQLLRCAACIDVFDTQLTEEKLSEIIRRWQVLSYAIGWYRSHNTNIQSELGMLQYPDDIARKIGFVKTADFFEKNNVTDFIDRFKQYGSGITAEDPLNHILRILRK